MNSLELKAERIRLGYSGDDMKDLLGLKSKDTYYKKEQGVSRFTPDQIVIVSNALRLTPEKISLIFFDGKLPIAQVMSS